MYGERGLSSAPAAGSSRQPPLAFSGRLEWQSDWDRKPGNDVNASRRNVLGFGCQLPLRNYVHSKADCDAQIETGSDTTFDRAHVAVPLVATVHFRLR